MNCHQGIFSDRLHLEMFEVFPLLSLTQLTHTLRSWVAPGTYVHVMCILYISRPAQFPGSQVGAGAGWRL